MKDFFKVTKLSDVIRFTSLFSAVSTETVPLFESTGRVLSGNITSDINIPDFMRSTMDGYAVKASSTFGASESSPAILEIKGAVEMGKPPGFEISHGTAAKIPTGGMLPDGADSIAMVEHTEPLDEKFIEVYKSVAPGQHVIGIGEDLKKGESLLFDGMLIRPQETGLLAALGCESVPVYRKPVIGIISTGDEIIPAGGTPEKGQIRDMNTYTLAGLTIEAGGIPKPYGIVKDDFDSLLAACREAARSCDMTVVSGGSSIGMRDYTIEALSSLADTSILTHGISISPGKPTILANTAGKPFWGLPGHVASAIIVFRIAVEPFIFKISGRPANQRNILPCRAVLTRNIASAQGRTDFIRVRLYESDGSLYAEPVTGKSGLINTLIKANGLVEIDMNTEGLDRGSRVQVIKI